MEVCNNHSKRQDGKEDNPYRQDFHSTHHFCYIHLCERETKFIKNGTDLIPHYYIGVLQHYYGRLLRVMIAALPSPSLHSPFVQHAIKSMS